MLYYLSLGSNIGERLETLDHAIGLIDTIVGTVTARSSYFYSEPWGFESEHEFCNCCIAIETPLSPDDVLRLTQDIERQLGRTHKSTDGIYHDRTIDIDLLLCFDEGKSISRHDDHLTLPHPLMQERDFVMTPLREILSDLSLISTPTTNMQSVIDFLRSCPAYYIATTEGDQPRVRPFSSLCPFEGKLYIESNRFKPFHHQIEANPKVEICAFDGISRWVRIECTLVDDPRVEAKKALLDYMPEIRDLGYDEHDENMSVYWMKDARATFYSYTADPYTVTF